MRKMIAYCGLDCEKMEKCPTVGMILADNAEALKNLKG